jgi:hypothetical protein
VLKGETGGVGLGVAMEDAGCGISVWRGLGVLAVVVGLLAVPDCERQGFERPFMVER